MTAARSITPSGTARIQERLLAKKPVKKGCLDRLWCRLLNSPNLLKYQSYNNMTVEFLSSCYTTSAFITDLTAATGLNSLPYVSDVHAFEPILLGACWGGVLMGFPIAYKFAKADADSHTVKSELIEQVHENKEEQQKDASAEITTDFELMANESDVIDVEIPEKDPENLPIIETITINDKPIRISKDQWRTSTLHLFNDTFKTMNDYLIYIKAIEDKFNPYQFLPGWAKPVIKAGYYSGLFFAAMFAKGEDFKNTVTSYEDKNRRLLKNRG